MKQTRLTKTLALLLLVAALVGCGGQTAAEREHEERDRALDAWSNHEGPAWAAYRKGWEAGWYDQCAAAVLKLERPEASGSVEQHCSFAPFESTPVDAPRYPPDYPAGEGREDGRPQGCFDGYYAMREKTPPRDFCPLP